MSPEPMQQDGYDFTAAAFEVYNDMGNGYTDDIYQEAIEMELVDRKIPLRPQAELIIHCKGKLLRKKFKPDLLVFEDLVVALKAVSALTSEPEAQRLNHLKATGKPVGCLVNFGCRDQLEWKRFARTRKISVN